MREAERDAAIYNTHCSFRKDPCDTEYGSIDGGRGYCLTSMILNDLNVEMLHKQSKQLIRVPGIIVAF